MAKLIHTPVGCAHATSWVLLAMMLCVGSGLGGCGSAKETRDAHVALLAEASGELSGDAVYPRRPASKVYVVRGGVRGAKQPEPRARRDVEVRADGTWVVRTTDADSGAAARTDVLTRTGAGVSLIESTDHERGTTTRFSGAGLLMMPASLRPEEAFASTVVAEVFGVEQGELRDRGTAEQRIEWTGQDRVSTPAGEFEAQRIEATMTLTLGQATVKRESRLWVAGEWGVIGEEVSERVSVFNVPVRGETRLWLIESYEAAPVLEVGDDVSDPIDAMLGQ